MIKSDIFKNKIIAVFGLASSGFATVNCLANSGAVLYVYDDKEELRNKIANLNYKNVTIIEPHQWPWQQITSLVLSPGVPLTFPKPNYVVELAKQSNVKIISDNEILYLSSPQAFYIGITGTNGKSTTTSLIYHILQTAKKDAQIGGNIGIPVLELNNAAKDGIYVIEMSSFQLDIIEKMRFNVSVLTNITPDHIDRHGNMENYIKAKENIFRHQNDSDRAVIGVDDNYGLELIERLSKNSYSGKIIKISGIQKQNDGIAVIDGILYDNTDGINKILTLGFIRQLQGQHNAQNIAAAYAAVKHLNISDQDIIDALKSFVGLEYRMEYTATINNVSFYNDSKATNADATAKALTISKHIFWILGGRAKDGGITTLNNYFSNISKAYLIGEASEEFANTLGKEVSFIKANTLDNAVSLATKDALDSGYEDAVVLLSPACASFDQFPNFMERGKKFRELVSLLAEQYKK